MMSPEQIDVAYKLGELTAQVKSLGDHVTSGFSELNKKFDTHALRTEQRLDTHEEHIQELKTWKATLSTKISLIASVWSAVVGLAVAIITKVFVNG